MPEQVDIKLMYELADAIDKDRGHNKSLLTRTLRKAADEIKVLRFELDHKSA